MDARQLRQWARGLVLGLLVVAVLSGVGGTFPRSVTAADGWDYLAGHATTLLHALGGVLALAAGGWLAWRLRHGGRGSLAAAVVGLLGTLTACAAGASYVGGGQHDGALTAMTVGWLVATACYAGLWWAARRALRRSVASS